MICMKAEVGPPWVHIARRVPPFASASNPSSGLTEHFPFPVASLIPSLAKFPTCKKSLR